MRMWMHILTTPIDAVENRAYGARAARLSINPGRRGLKPRLRSLCRVSLQQMCWYACAFFIAYCGIAQAQVAEHYAHGMRAMKLGLYAEAATAFQHVLQLNPQHAEAYCELGAAYRLQDKTNDAADAYRHALSLIASPETHGVAHVCLARIYHSQGKFAEAEKHAQNAVSLLPKSAEPFLRLGDVYVQRGKLTAAQRAYQKAIALDVSLAEGYPRCRTRRFYGESVGGGGEVLSEKRLNSRLITLSRTTTSLSRIANSSGWQRREPNWLLSGA